MRSSFARLNLESFEERVTPGALKVGISSTVQIGSVLESSTNVIVDSGGNVLPGGSNTGPVVSNPPPPPPPSNP
ncbi:MAG: hypothetical protein R3B84_23045 [Zavarzinella sp.]